VADDGTVYVSWIDGRERTRAELERDGGADGHDVVRETNHGNGHGHAMHDASLPASQVRIARSTDGGRSFQPGVVAAGDVCPCCRTALAVGPGGRVHVAFRSATDNLRDIMIATSTDGAATFAEPVRVHRDDWNIDACPHAGATLALDADGRLHVAWYTGAEQRQGVWYAVADDGIAFGEPAPIMTGGWVPVSQVKLAAGADGVWIAWDDRRDDVNRILAAPAAHNAAARARLVGTGRSPAIAVGNGLVVAWHNDTSAHVLRVAATATGR
jgi:hypothetical protein